MNDLGEFELIERYFRHPTPHALVGPGDDCAVLPAPAAGMALAVSSDMLVEGRHFLPTVPPRLLGHKALAVNLSDLAAAGARPLAFTLALALPRVDASWLEGFSDGLMALAREHGCELVGGDVTAGPLNICITVFGEVPERGALLRSGARPGDEIWLSGPLGDARLALEAFRGKVELDGADFRSTRRAMEAPQPRVVLGQALRGLASAAIDISDGLLGDLGHVMRASRVGARIDTDSVPRSPALARQPLVLQRECCLNGGDDYELVFTAPADAATQVQAAGERAGLALARIGRIEAEPGLRLVDGAGRPLTFESRSFDHFRS
jgi:thiamine-monophosphate kinase